MIIDNALKDNRNNVIVGMIVTAMADRTMTNGSFISPGSDCYGLGRML